MLEELGFQLKHFIKVGNINAALLSIRDVPKASQFELKNNYTNLFIQINGTLQGEQEKEHLMVFVSLCKRNFGLAPQYTAWIRALNNEETALAYLKVNGISLDQLIYLYSRLSFAVWPSLITKLVKLPNINMDILSKFWNFTLAKQNLPLYEEIGTILSSSLSFPALPMNLQDYREKLLKYSIESRKIIAELHQTSQNWSHFEVLTSSNRRLEEYQNFISEVFTIENYTQAQLNQLFKNKRVYLYVIEELAKVQKLSVEVLNQGLQNSINRYDLFLLVKLSTLLEQYFPEFQCELPVNIANKKQFLLQFDDEAQLVSEILVNGYITDEPNQKLFERILCISLQQASNDETYSRYENFWIRSVKTNHSNLKTLFQNLPPQVFQDLLKPIVEKKDILSIDNLHEFKQYILSEYNLTLFKYIEKIIKTYYSEHTFPPLSVHQIKTIELLERCSPETLEKLQQLIQQLTRGFGYIVPEYERTAAAFILAITRQDKLEKYDYLPTIVMESNFLDYLALLIQKKNVSERFLHAPSTHTGHWRCGEIEIKNGAIKLFLINSEGLDDEEDIEEVITNSISKRFSKTKMDIYLSLQKRQFSEMGCSVFALDDIRHLYTLTQYTNESVFEQLDRFIVREEEVNNLQIYACKLPPTLLRTMQSKEIRNVLQSDEDYAEEHVVTKPKPNNSFVPTRGLTVKESVDQGFKFNAEIGKEQNFRLAEKLQKMCQRVDTYIIAKLYDNPEEGYRALAELAANHTFPAFQNRMSQEETSIKYHEQMHLTLLGKRRREDSADTEDTKSSALRVDLPKHRG